jgi:cephalosporin hydroxylase
MHPESYQEMSRMVTQYLPGRLPLHVLDVGSYAVNGSYKPLFTERGCHYTGLDQSPGPNVDVVLKDPYRFPFPRNSFDVLISGQAFEHIPRFWETWSEMVRVLKPGGWIFLIAPSRGVEHRYPVDCWRFYRDGFRALGEWKQLEIIEAETRWETTWGDCIGVFRKPDRTGWKSLLGRWLKPSAETPPPAPVEASANINPSTPRIRDAEYRDWYDRPISEWALHHQAIVLALRASWLGIPTLKNPLDAWVMQEILHEVRPDIVVEIGGGAGGSALFFCTVLEGMAHGRVVSIEADARHWKASHPRLTLIEADCADRSVIKQVQELCAGKRTLIVHDADHTRSAVLRDLQAYSPLVSPGSYFVVEDGIVDVLDIPGFTGEGPLAAIRDFIRNHPEFEIDKSRERYLLTYNPSGYIRRRVSP